MLKFEYMSDKKTLTHVVAGTSVVNFKSAFQEFFIFLREIGYIFPEGVTSFDDLLEYKLCDLDSRTLAGNTNWWNGYEVSLDRNKILCSTVT